MGPNSSMGLSLRMGLSSFLLTFLDSTKETFLLLKIKYHFLDLKDKVSQVTIQAVSLDRSRRSGRVALVSIRPSIHHAGRRLHR